MKYEFDFTGKTAIVTGARSGIGRAIAEAFGQTGTNVVCAGRRPCTDTVDTITAASGKAITVCCDVSIEDNVTNLIKTAKDEFGSVDILVNNAGTGNPGSKLHEYSMEDFDHTFAVDVRGVFMGMKYAIPEMLEAGGGAIINIASVAGIVADPDMAAYSSAKHAVVGLTRAGALDYADQNIRINCLAPGFIKSELTQIWLDDPVMYEVVKGFNFQHRAGEPEEIAGMALFLASDMASFMDGAIIPIDAAQSAH